MLVVSATPHETDLAGVADEGTDLYGMPCTFGGCAGFFHPARGQVGVVLCAPWGFEDLTMRKSWRLLAEAIAAAGYPCLRFDYPGTGDSLGRATEVATVDEWIASIHAGADFLRRSTGVKRFVFVGQSLGATLAVEAARTRGDVAALHLIAPVVKGRAHVRELSATSKLVADRLGIVVEPNADEALSVMGFSMSPSLVDSIRHLDVTRNASFGTEIVAIYDQPDRKATAEFGEHLRKLGAAVSFDAVEPYHLMVSDATVIQPLPVEIERFVFRLQALTPAGESTAVVLTPASAVLVGEGFREEPLRFGSDGSLFGILCTPERTRGDKPAIIHLNRGLNAHIGWRRVAVDQARGLALAGLTSLRIDVAGLGESRDAPDRPHNLIYSDLLLPDIRAAVDALVSRGHTRIMLAGVCSGAYMALQAAHADPRVTSVVAVNTQRLVWNPRESVEDVIRFGLRSMSDYVGDIKSGSALRKLIRSRKRIAPAIAFLAKRQVKAAIAWVPLRLRSIVLRDVMAGRVDRFFSTLAAYGTRVSLVYAGDDPGLMELRTYYGPNGRDLRNPKITVSLIPGADHNLTTTATSTWMLEHLIAVANEPAYDGARAPARRASEPRRAVCPT